MDTFKQWVSLLCQYGLENKEFFEEFWENLQKYPDIYEELEYYAKNGDFLAKATISNYTIIDILVWQIDHFKSHMDRGEYDMQSNPERMVLMAFYTFLKMKSNPAPYIAAMQSETGTDYEGKY